MTPDKATLKTDLHHRGKYVSETNMYGGNDDDLSFTH